MQSDAFTLYKLIILFLLDKVDFPLTNAQISNFILEKDYTNYFNIQQSISELIEAEFVTVETIGHSSHYRITDSGRETLSFFGYMISTAIQSDILEYLKSNKYSLRDEVSTLSEYYEAKKGEYMVRLRVVEKEESIIDLNIAVPTKEDAVRVCDNWRTQSQQIYAYVLSNLLREEE
jgi:DNA-binding PadR family transcriptional regulator